MNAKLNFLSKHEENRPFCAKALLLAVALWFACAAGAMAQGNGGGNDGVITGQERPQYIYNADQLKYACGISDDTEDMLYVLMENIERTEEFEVK